MARLGRTMSSSASLPLRARSFAFAATHRYPGRPMAPARISFDGVFAPLRDEHKFAEIRVNPELGRTRHHLLGVWR